MFLSVTLMLLAIRGLRFWAAFGIGLLAGLSFHLSQVEWLTLYLGPIPWLALGTLEALIFASGMGATALVWRWLGLSPRPGLRRVGLSLALAVMFVAREWVANNLPYGGFPWSRLAQSQADSPLANWAFYGGLGALSLVVAILAAQLAVWLGSWLEHRQGGGVAPDAEEALARGSRLGGAWTATKPAAAVVSLSVSIGLILVSAVTVLPKTGDGLLVVGAVQGNANAGLFANPDRGSILRNHLEATELLPDTVTGEPLDVIVWPENASDVSPLADPEVAAQLDALVQDRQLPLVFGTITSRGEAIYNSSIYWDPDEGPIDYYDKKRPVPFAEYVPDRDFWYQLAPDLVGLISRGYDFGTRDGIFELAKADAGVLICFEIAIDAIGRELVRDGAQIIFSQTNNADFGRSDETFQQFAFARLRAIETGRAIVNISTVGVSGMILPNGEVIEELPFYEPAAMAAAMPLRSDLTPAMRFGDFVDLSINAGAILLFSMSLWRRFRPARHAREMAGDGGA